VDKRLVTNIESQCIHDIRRGNSREKVGTLLKQLSPSEIDKTAYSLRELVPFSFPKSGYFKMFKFLHHNKICK